MANILVIAEHDAGQLKLATLSALGFAAQTAATTHGVYDVLVIGAQVGTTAESLRAYGARQVLVADAAPLQSPLADRHAWVIEAVVKQRDYGIVVAAASTFTKDILPRAAALLDAGMLSDVVGVSRTDDDLVFKRVMYAGNVLATVTVAGDLKFLTIRAAAFAPVVAGTTLSPVEQIPLPAGPMPDLAEYGGREAKVAGRPDATEARVVVSGGRAIKNAEDFERLVGGLADALGGAVGSSRALVDSGITPNSLQIGQTGKIVAPDLYLAVGISGAIQHLAGIKDSKVIVAINKDADAPIFEIADYGLVADVYTAVPELTAQLKQ